MLDQNGDYVFGHGSADFLVNSPATVAQAVLTRLKLFTDEWFLDQNEGTPYSTQITGKGTSALYDLAIKNRILSTQSLGVSVVTAIISYSSQLIDRNLQVTAEIDTIYGPTTVSTFL